MGWCLILMTHHLRGRLRLASHFSVSRAGCTPCQAPVSAAPTAHPGHLSQGRHTARELCSLCRHRSHHQLNFLSKAID